MISKGGIIDPLHRQVPSIASLEWIKVFFPPPLSPPLRERLYNQSISVTYMGSLGAKSPFKKQLEEGHMEQWLLNRGTLGDLQGVTEDATVRSHCSHIYQSWKFIHPFIKPWDLLQIVYLRWSPQREKVQERLLYRQSASCAVSRLSL